MGISHVQPIRGIAAEMTMMTIQMVVMIIEKKKKEALNYEDVIFCTARSMLMLRTIGMFVSGYIADQVDIRRFLSIGMISAGLSSVFLGLGHQFGVHHLSYYLLVSAWGGISQSVGWPCVVTVMGRFFPRTYKRRGS